MSTSEANVFYKLHKIPKPEWDELWDRIFIKDGMKLELLSYGTIAKNIQSYNLSKKILNIHGVILLYGPPGNGKTSLAFGFANKVSRQYTQSKSLKCGAEKNGAKCIYINPHVESKWLGESQKRTQKVFKVIKKLAQKGTLTFCILDEAESLLTRRDTLSGSDPSDVFKSVNLVLRELDELVDMPNVFVVATSNITQALDSAFMDRTDRNFFIGYPDIEARSRILRDSFEEMNSKVKTKLKMEGQQFEELVYKTQGLSGRGIRKLVLKAYMKSQQAAENPSKLGIEEILKAAQDRGGKHAEDRSKD